MADTVAAGLLAAIPPAVSAAIELGLKLPGTGYIGLGQFLGTELMKKAVEEKLRIEEWGGNVEGAKSSRAVLARLNASQTELGGTMDIATGQLIQNAMARISAGTKAAITASISTWGSIGNPPVTADENRLKALIGHVYTPMGSGDLKATAANTATTNTLLREIRGAMRQTPQALTNQ